MSSTYMGCARIFTLIKLVNFKIEDKINNEYINTSQISWTSSIHTFIGGVKSAVDPTAKIELFKVYAIFINARSEICSAPIKNSK